MFKRLFCCHEYYKVGYLGNERFTGQFRGKYLTKCHKCGKESQIYGEPLFPLTRPPVLHEESKSEYDKSYHELQEEVKKAELEIERLINIRNNLGHNSHFVEQAIRRNWKHIKTCKMWMSHVYGDEYREFLNEGGEIEWD